MGCARGREVVDGDELGEIQLVRMSVLSASRGGFLSRFERTFSLRGYSSTSGFRRICGETLALKSPRNLEKKTDAGNNG